jgi:hypothetical protein
LKAAFWRAEARRTLRRRWFTRRRGCEGDAAGDVLLFAVGAGQLHGGVRTVFGIVHADAGLRRVVERPGWPEWLLLGAWRYEGRG